MKNILKHTFPPDLTGLFTQELANQLANTTGAIQGLNQMSRLLHNPSLLMRPILGKEAEASSQLEGTQASIEDVYKIDVVEQSPDERDQAIEIKNYEAAMFTGLDILEKTDFTPLLIREIHKRLMQGVRGRDKHPGEFRKGEVWVGILGTSKEKARYLLPDATQVPILMDNLYAFIKARGDIHPLIACGIIHHRFEAIHPFEDGNGRTGRLLISLYLLSQKLLTFPILYPSGYFEKNKDEYMNALAVVDESEDWYSWIMYFLKGMEVQAKVSLQIAIDIDKLFKKSRSFIENERANLNLIRVLEYSFTQPYLTSSLLNRELDIPRASCDRYLQTLAEKKVITDLGIIKKQKIFVNINLLNLLKAI